MAWFLTKKNGVEKGDESLFMCVNTIVEKRRKVLKFTQGRKIHLR